jgi:hypothetical protein
MTHVIEGQCGLCTHYGEHSKLINSETLVKIRKTHEADDAIIAECGHPRNEKMHLKVTPFSACDGFQSVKQFQSMNRSAST